MKHVIFKYAWKNVSRRLRITGSLLICVFLSVFSIVLAWGTYDAIDSGIELSKSQLSADVMVYPYEVDISDVSMLYSGIAQSVYMDESVLDQLNNNYTMESPAPTELTTFPFGASDWKMLPSSATKTAPSPAMDTRTFLAPFSCIFFAYVMTSALFPIFTPKISPSS